MKRIRKPGKAETQSRRHPASQVTAQRFSYYAASRRSHDSPATSRRTAESTRHAHSGHDHQSGRTIFQQLRQRAGTIVLGLVLAACVISLLQLDTKPRVVILNNAASYALRSPSVYQAAITKTLRSSLANTNKVTVNSRQVVSDLKRQFPEIYDASLVLPLVGHRPTVYIELARPVVRLQTPSQTIVVDQTGRALASVALGERTQFSSFNLPVVIDQSQLDLHVGDIVLSSNSVQFIREVTEQLAAKKVAITRLTLPAGTQELDVYPAGVPYTVKFNLHDPTSARQQVGTYLAVRQQLGKQGSMHAEPKQYIDVRLTGRAYYQ